MFAIISKFFGGSYLTIALAVAIAGLTLTCYVQHKTNGALSLEVSAIKSQLSTSQDVNHTDEIAIGESQAALTSCLSQFAAAGAASSQAATAARDEHTRLASSLASSQSTLKSLLGKPSDASFLKTDLNAQYPDIARVLRGNSSTDR
jgi:hypothetical protein